MRERMRTPGDLNSFGRRLSGKRSVRSLIGTRLAAMLALVAACFACGCCGAGPDDGIAARYDGGSVTEDEVSAYTADYRQAKSYGDADVWAQHLLESGLTTATWRDQAIGAIVDERLQLARAAELGIAPDEERIADEIASDKEDAGIAAGDDAAWEACLAARGTTAGLYRADLEKASLISQLLAREVSLDAVDDEEELAESYVEGELLDRVARRYRALAFDTREAAQAALDDMAGLSGDELRARFDSWLSRDDSAETTDQGGGDIGWDIASDWGDVQQELGGEMVAPGELSTQVHELDGMFYVLMCADRFVFERGQGLDGLPDDELREHVLTATAYANWSQMTADYVAGLREAAHVQVREMPSGLPYDVDDKITELAARVEIVDAAQGTSMSSASDETDQAGE